MFDGYQVFVQLARTLNDIFHDQQLAGTAARSSTETFQNHETF
jgi:hypothetical protein